MSRPITELERKQIRQAEELLFSGPRKEGFAQDLFFGRFRSGSILPYPRQTAEEQQRGDEAVAAVREFAQRHINPDRIDREADIPPDVIRGLGELGVLGMTVSPEHGGRGMSQFNYCRVMEIIGARCAATAVFVNAHHSIGLRALELFGTEEQKARWMRPLAAGEELAAFALTEPEAGSDAANVQTRAEPTDDGRGYVLHGEKRYITNGGIAGVLTVMARVPAPREHSGETTSDGRVTAFLVTPDMPGFEVVEARMEKCGIRGTATARLAFQDMFVPKENVLGPVGKGLRVALTVLDFGRTTFGASCTGAAKSCLDRMIERANTRKQFGKTLGEFELVKHKIAQAAADTLAMECATYHTAALIDSGAEDYMLETAMLKVFASEALWRIVNDTLQIWGGAGYFSDQPFERMMRDARINLIGEGANDVLRCFVAMVGLRHVSQQLLGVLKRPWQASRLVRWKPHVPLPPRTSENLAWISRLEPAAHALARQVQQFGRACRTVLMRHREGILNRQYVQARIGDTATDLYLSSCVFSRLYSIVEAPPEQEKLMRRELETGLLFLRSAWRRNRARLSELRRNDDDLQNAVADGWLNE
ncbi:MAG: acyl-CoA dehydrogenase family protein [Planctomycetaceae bacterium]